MKLRYIFIPFICVLLMSHNVSAVDLSNSVKYVQGVARPYWQSSHNESAHQGSYSFGNNFDYTSSNWIRIKSATNTNLSVDAGNYVSITGKVIAYSSVGGNANTNVLSQPYTVWGPGAATSSDGVDCNLVDYSFDTYTAYSTTGYEYTYNFEWICRATNGNIINPVTNFWVNNRNPGTGGTTRADLNIARVTVWEPVDGFDDTDIINAINRINNSINSLNNNVIDTNDKLDQILESQENVNDFINEEQESIDNINNQSPSDIQDSENAGTTNLIGALGGFFTTIANTPATNCIINGDLGHVDIGGIDLCQGKENFNTIVEFIGFTALFGVVFWAGYHLVRRTLSLIDWARSK